MRGVALGALGEWGRTVLTYVGSICARVGNGNGWFAHHHLGPPRMKMIIKKQFHHMWKDVVKGSVA
jgi:hypothetical protein